MVGSIELDGIIDGKLLMLGTDDNDGAWLVVGDDVPSSPGVGL